MSSFAYGELSSKREEAAPTTSSTTSPPGVSIYVDALAALVPTEVLTLHAFLLSITTKTEVNEAGEIVTTITDPGTLAILFWILLLLSCAFFLVGHLRKGRQYMHKPDLIRMMIPAVAFVLWTMLQKTTAFDAVWPGLGDVPRYAFAVVGAVVLGLVTAFLATKADAAPSPGPAEPQQALSAS